MTSDCCDYMRLYWTWYPPRKIMREHIKRGHAARHEYIWSFYHTVWHMQDSPSVLGDHKMQWTVPPPESWTPIIQQMREYPDLPGWLFMVPRTTKELIEKGFAIFGYFKGTTHDHVGRTKSVVFRFVKRPPIIPPPGVYEYQDEVSDSRGSCQEWNANAQTLHPREDHTLRQLEVHIGRELDIVRGPFVIKLERYTDVKYPGTLLATAYGHTDDLPAYPDRVWYKKDITPVEVHSGDNLRIVVHTIEPWYHFHGGFWWPEWWIAGMRWTLVGEDPYPRGKAWYGYNYKASSGWYNEFVDCDMSFFEWGTPF